MSDYASVIHAAATRRFTERCAPREQWGGVCVGVGVPNAFVAIGADRDARVPPGLALCASSPDYS